MGMKVGGEDALHPTTRAQKTSKRAKREKVVEVHGPWCYYCGDPWNIEDHHGSHLDHFIPLSMGGPDSRENLVPACKNCNVSKGGKPPEEFRRYLTGKRWGMPYFQECQKDFLRVTLGVDLDGWLGYRLIQFSGEHPAGRRELHVWRSP